MDCVCVCVCDAPVYDLCVYMICVVGEHVMVPIVDVRGWMSEGKFVESTHSFLLSLVLGIKFRLPGFHGKCLCSLGHLASLMHISECDFPE